MPTSAFPGRIGRLPSDERSWGPPRHVARLPVEARYSPITAQSRPIMMKKPVNIEMSAIAP